MEDQKETKAENDMDSGIILLCVGSRVCGGSG